MNFFWKYLFSYSPPPVRSPPPTRFSVKAVFKSVDKMSAPLCETKARIQKLIDAKDIRRGQRSNGTRMAGH